MTLVSGNYLEGYPMSKSDALLGKNIPLVEAAHVGKRQRPTALVLRTSWTTGEAGSANGIAQAWHNPNNKLDSCHYVVDAFQTIRCVPDKLESFYTEHPHRRVISINVCHNPPSPPEDEVVLRVAKLSARLCKLYRIPARILSKTEEAKWVKHPWRHRGGILLSTVGTFPATTFSSFVGEAYKQY